VRNPWIGLRPFATGESDLFFGRRKETRILGNLVATLPVLIVYAPSGTGKSSLINAGLAHELQNDPGQVVIFVEPQGDIAAATRASLRGHGFDAPDVTDLDELLERHHAETERRAIILIDQFEERLNAGIPTEETFRAMARMAHSTTDAGCVVLSIREDYLGNLEPLMRRVPSLLDSSYRVPPLTREALESAIYGPLERIGSQLDAAVSVEDALVKRTLDDLTARSTQRQEPGEQRFEPGYFQIVWSRLWEECGGANEKLTVAGYKRLGGADQILKDFTSGVLESLEPAQAQMFWAMSRYLVLPTGAKTALTVDDLSDLLQASDYMPGPVSGHSGGTWLSGLDKARRTALIKAVLGRLIASDAPLFQRVIRSDREEFELLHDLLGRILLEWREEYVAAVRADVRARISSITATARSTLRTLVIDPSDSPGTRRRLGAFAEDALKQIDAYCERLSRSPDTAASLVDDGYRLLAVVGAMESLQYGRHFANFGLDLDLDPALARFQGLGLPGRHDLGPNRRIRSHIAQAVATRALDDPAVEVRRRLQELAPFWATAEMQLSVRFRTEWREFASDTTAGICFALISFVLAYAVLAGSMANLGIAVPGLTLAHATLVFAAMYAALFSDAEGESEASKLVSTAIGPLRATGRLKLLGFLVWPAPALIVVALSLGCAHAFEALGIAATAGFNFGMLWVSIAMVAALSFVYELWS